MAKLQTSARMNSLLLSTAFGIIFPFEFFSACHSGVEKISHRGDGEWLTERMGRAADPGDLKYAKFVSITVEPTFLVRILNFFKTINYLYYHQHRGKRLITIFVFINIVERQKVDIFSICIFNDLQGFCPIFLPFFLSSRSPPKHRIT